MAVQGLERLKRQLRGFFPLQRDAVAHELHDGAEDLARAIARAAPRGPDRVYNDGRLPGHMADKVKSEPAKAAEGEHVLGSAGLAYRVSAPFPARFVENGTKARPKGVYKDDKGKTRTSKRAHPATPAEPFFWPTVRAHKDGLTQRIKTASRKAAKAAARL